MECGYEYAWCYFVEKRRARTLGGNDDLSKGGGFLLSLRCRGMRVDVDRLDDSRWVWKKGDWGTALLGVNVVEWQWSAEVRRRRLGSTEGDEGVGGGAGKALSNCWASSVPPFQSRTVGLAVNKLVLSSLWIDWSILCARSDTESLCGVLLLQILVDRCLCIRCSLRRRLTLLAPVVTMRSFFIRPSIIAFSLLLLPRIPNSISVFEALWTFHQTYSYWDQHLCHAQMTHFGHAFCALALASFVFRVFRLFGEPIWRLLHTAEVEHFRNVSIVV